MPSTKIYFTHTYMASKIVNTVLRFLRSLKQILLDRGHSIVLEGAIQIEEYAISAYKLSYGTKQQ